MPNSELSRIIKDIRERSDLTSEKLNGYGFNQYTTQDINETFSTYRADHHNTSSLIHPSKMTNSTHRSKISTNIINQVNRD